MAIVYTDTSEDSLHADCSSARKPKQCVFTTPQAGTGGKRAELDPAAVFAGKSVWFYGDSTLRQVFSAFNEAVQSSGRTALDFERVKQMFRTCPEQKRRAHYESQ